MNWSTLKRAVPIGSAMTLLFLPGIALAQDAAEAAPESALLADVDTLWVCLAAFLVFFMQAGFALVECGFTRAKNACNIIMKNVMDFSIGTIAFWMVGFGLMFGATNGYFGTTNFLYDAGSNNFNWAFLIFQTVFCATAATIVSGAMAERTKFIGYLCYTVAITVIVYPIFGSWAWGGLLDGGGWLEDWGFYDFAGSTVVHSVGGWCALAGAIVLGPRLGKYSKDGKTQAIPGHNIPLAALGVFILWLGWFGFNPGSTTAVGGGSFAYIAVTTNLAAAAGAVAATIASWVLFKKPDTSFALNGALAGLVAITAGCDAMSPIFAVITGFASGLLVVGSVRFFDKIKIDDPVGAISVHGVCGVWGTLAIGLFHTEGGLLVGGGTTQIVAQLVGIGAAFVWAFFVSLAIFLVIKYTIGLRVSQAEEMEGLDVAEHGMHAYPAHLITEGHTGSPLAPTMVSMPSSPAVSPVANPSPEGA
ncbi:MAG: ammonium transporter [Pirellulaceae bacterium]|nr:ammonium transporter [Pirellulaceae bacterium]HJN07393.1 ammonium transporter [Pirellulaceae bacterium]